VFVAVSGRKFSVGRVRSIGLVLVERQAGRNKPLVFISEILKYAASFERRPGG
jgi:hypothetical protein